TFVAIAYLVEVYGGSAAAIRNPIQGTLHLLFFSRILAGPIVRPCDVANDLARRTLERKQFAAAVRRFIIGLGKKVLIAGAVADVADRIFAIPAVELRPAVAWLGIVCYTAQIYFDFCGYTDMAIALGNMFGFRFPENFNYPYVATTVREFWRRWHITLSSWLRDYLYFPLGGNRCAPWRGYLNLGIVFLLCGLWHGARWTFIVWGLFQGVFLIIERLGWEELQGSLWRPLRHGYFLLVLMVSWVFFRSETLAQAFGYLWALAGLSSPTGVQDDVVAYLNPQVAIALIAAVVGSIPTVPALRRWWTTRADQMSPPCVTHGICEAGTLVFLALVLAASIFVVAASTYTPFIYTQF
ncbi:MAG: MBOAT family protein, partial [Verrucomicrobia bacterium]|nr:MBOAT family protein [Verrucomicrobiota bacterium]